MKVLFGMKCVIAKAIMVLLLITASSSAVANNVPKIIKTDMGYFCVSATPSISVSEYRIYLSDGRYLVQVFKGLKDSVEKLTKAVGGEWSAETSPNVDVIKLVTNAVYVLPEKTKVDSATLLQEVVFVPSKKDGQHINLIDPSRKSKIVATCVERPDITEEMTKAVDFFKPKVPITELTESVSATAFASELPSPQTNINYGQANAYDGASRSVLEYVGWVVVGLILTLILPVIALLLVGAVNIDDLAFLTLQRNYNKTGEIDTSKAHFEAGLSVIVVIILLLIIGPIVLWFKVAYPLIQKNYDHADTTICCVVKPSVTRDASFAVDFYVDDSVGLHSILELFLGDSKTITWKLRLIDLKKGEFVDLSNLGARITDRRTVSLVRPNTSEWRYLTAQFQGNRLVIKDQPTDNAKVVFEILPNTIGYQVFPDETKPHPVALWVDKHGSTDPWIKGEYSNSIMTGINNTTEMTDANGTAKTVQFQFDPDHISQGGLQSNVLIAEKWIDKGFFRNKGMMAFVDIRTSHVLKQVQTFGRVSWVSSSDDGDYQVFRADDYLKLYRMTAQ